MTRIGTAMVLAAGLGKRMRPLTATRPKPLVEVAGQPLLDHVLDRLRAAGIGRVVVNVHYLADALEAHLARYNLRPREVLDFVEACGSYPVGEVIEGDLRFPLVIRLADRWRDDEMDALLLLVPQARANCHTGLGDFHMDPLGRITRRRPSKVAPFVYTGVQLVSKRLFTDLPAGPFGFMLLWERAIAAGRAFGFVHQGLWFDVGTPPAIGKTEAMLGLN